jgi:hypothetical protein
VFKSSDWLEIEIKNALPSDKIFIQGIELNNDGEGFVYRETGDALVDLTPSSSKATYGKEPSAASEASAEEDYGRDEFEPTDGTTRDEPKDEPPQGPPSMETEDPAVEQPAPAPSTGGNGKGFVAIVKRSNKTGILKIQLRDGCRLDEIQDLVLRRLMVQVLRNAKDKATKKIVQLSCKTGTAPLFRTSVGIDVLPPLFELPEKLTQEGLTFKPGLGGHLDVFPQASVGTGNFVGFGAALNVKFTQDGLPHNLLISATASGKHGISVRETRDQPRDTVLFDGKKIGEVKLTGKNQLDIELADHPQISNVIQRVIRSIAFDSTYELASAVKVMLRVVDLNPQHPLSLSIPVSIGPMQSK